MNRKLLEKYGFHKPTRMKVESIGRHHYLVQSETRKEVKHVTDLEGTMPSCSCENYNEGKNLQCKHVRLCLMLQEANLLPK